MLIENVSVVIIASNAEAKLRECLDSLRDFSEVIVYENNSTDKTVEIAQNYKNVKLTSGAFLGFGKTKNLAASLSANEWVLSLDSDEVLDENFVNSLKKMDLKSDTVYKIYRVNFYKDSQVKHCWGDETIVRLYNKSETSFANKDVHEHVLEDRLDTKLLQGVVKHYPYNTITDFITKLDRYSTLFAQNNAGEKSSSPTKAFFNGVYSFIKTYIFKQGFLDGHVGLVIAFSHMATNFYKYMKLYELNEELKSSKDSK